VVQLELSGWHDRKALIKLIFQIEMVYQKMQLIQPKQYLNFAWKVAVIPLGEMLYPTKLVAQWHP
jgi:hypothetical protein